VEAAQRILSSGFRISRNEYDWLGDGVYFFQDAPLRAWKWARQRFGEQAAVVGAEIDLSGCVGLLNIPWEHVIVRTFERYIEHLTHARLPIPRQTRGAHRLDRGVINYLVDGLARDGMRVRSLRAVFPEGEPMYPDSALLTRAHVQIAVRDRTAIVRTWREEEEAVHAQR
ncbi:MAG TPA: hypothetical protein VGX50_15090, partial [Longimicrobium sp.]|nr:hypothetical protein [Longimicrobium sp.]